jgi:uroporphyrinogen-III synthase
VRGKRVAVLESRLGAQVVDLVARRGAIPVHAPALSEIPDLDPQAIAVLVRSLASRAPSAFVFQTGVGTRALFAATDSLGLTDSFREILEHSVVVVRGPKPGGALRATKVRIDREAAEPFTTREVLQAMAGLALEGQTVVVQRHGSENRELDRALEAAGARVVEIPTYRWSLPDDRAPLERLVDELAGGRIDAAIFTNAEQARNLFRVAAAVGKTGEARAGLNRALVASIGPVASAALREAGVRVGVEAKPPKLGALLAAVDAALAG